MSAHKDFVRCLYIAKFFGIISITFDERTTRLIVTTMDIIYGKLMSAFIYITCAMSVLIFYINKLNSSLYDHQTGEIAVKIQVIIGSVTRTALTISIFYRRRKNLRIIENIFEQLLISSKEERRSSKSLRRNFIASLILLMCLTLNIFNHLINVSLGDKTLFFISLAALLPNGFICAFLSLFASVVIAIRLNLESLNAELLRLATENHDDMTSAVNKFNLARILRIRSRILVMCVKDMNEVYGISIGLIGGEIFLLAASLPVAISEVLDQWELPFWGESLAFVNMIVSGMFPMGGLFWMALRSNNLEVEVNKTARILSRMSRRGTDIEKMVDKFLMKNMQQKPILTAYGFFPLNKRTLFKIFAAIFTYMVILIQFKDMESTNMRLVGTKPLTTTSTIVAPRSPRS